MVRAKKYRESLEEIWKIAGREDNLFLVGGTVRDILLARELTDFDISGDFDPYRVGNDFARVSEGTLVPIGEPFGTVRVVNKDGIFDLSAIRGANIYGDLKDRDITLNAMAYPLKEFLREGFSPGKIIDPLHGREDLENKVVRALSEKNLLDDPVRLFRIFRFASQLGFSIEEETEKMTEKNAGAVGEVKGERAREEIFNVFKGDSFKKVSHHTCLMKLISIFTGIEVDESTAGKRVPRVLEGVTSPSYEGVREVFFRNVSGERRAMDNIILLSYLWKENRESLPDALFNTLRLSRKEKNVLSRVVAVMGEGLFPARGTCPIKPEALFHAGFCLPHAVLFADGVGAFGDKRDVVKKIIKYYIENKGRIDKRRMPWSAEKAVSLYLRKGGKIPKRIMRELMIETLSGKIESDEDVVEFLDMFFREKGNG